MVGPSGAGKTTVLNILGGMDTASSGRVIVDGKDIAQYSPRQLTAYRRDDIGFVFQFYNLIPNLTALENVELALQICKNPMDAQEVMEDVGLGERLDNFPASILQKFQNRLTCIVIQRSCRLVTQQSDVHFLWTWKCNDWYRNYQCICHGAGRDV